MLNPSSFSPDLISMAGGSETGAQLFARLGSRPSLQGLCPQLFGEDFPKPGGLIEFCGESGTAKTECLLNFAASCILPPAWKGYDLGGIGCGVVFIDTQNQFSMLRAFTLLEKRVAGSIDSGSLHSDDVGSSSSTLGQSSEVHPSDEGIITPERNKNKPEADEIEACIKACLERLYVIRCNSSQQLLITLHSLENFFANRSDVCVVMIDAWSAFYWKDRAGFGDQPSSAENCQKRSTAALKKLLEDHHLIVFLTRCSSLRSTGRQETQRGSSYSPSVSQRTNAEPDRGGLSTDFGHSELKKLATQRYTMERFSQVTESGNVQAVFKATRVYPQPSKTEHFAISEKEFALADIDAVFVSIVKVSSVRLLSKMYLNW